MRDHDATIELPITGMTCASCVARTERAIGKVEGVDTAAVNLATEKATVTLDPDAVRRAISSPPSREPATGW